MFQRQFAVVKLSDFLEPIPVICQIFHLHSSSHIGTYGFSMRSAALRRRYDIIRDSNHVQSARRCDVIVVTRSQP